MAYENYTENSSGFVGFSGHLEHYNPQFGIVKLGENRTTGFGVFAGFDGTDAGDTRYVKNLPPGLRSSGYVAVIFEAGEPVLKMYKGTAVIAAGEDVTYNGVASTGAAFIGLPSDTHWQDPAYWVTVQGGTGGGGGGGIDFQDENGDALGNDDTGTLQITGTTNEVEVTSGVASDIATYTVGLPDDVLISDTLGVGGAATLSSTLSVSGASTFNADVDLQNNNIVDVRNIELTAISPRTSSTDINFNVRNNSENALEFQNADNPGVVYMSIRTTQSNLDGVHIDRDFYIDNLQTSLSADVVVKDADGKLYYRTVNEQLLQGGDLNISSTDLSASYPVQLTGAASNVISIAPNYYLRKNVTETTTGTLTAGGLRTNGAFILGATSQSTIHRDSLPVANTENYHLLMIDDEQADGDFTDRVKRKQVFATGIFNQGGLSIQSDTDLVAGQNLSFGTGGQSNVLNVEDVVRTDLTSQDYQFVTTPLKVGASAVNGGDALMHVTNVVPSGGAISTTRFLKFNDGSQNSGGTNIFKRGAYTVGATTVPFFAISNGDTDTGLNAPFMITDGDASDHSGLGKIVAMNRAGFGDLTGSQGEGVFNHFDSPTNSETKVMFSGVGGETSVYFGGGTSGNNTQVVVGPYVTWNFQGTVINNNTVGTTINVPYYELGAGTALSNMPMGIFDKYTGADNTADRVRSYAILPATIPLQLGSITADTALLENNSGLPVAKQSAQIFVADSVTGADTNSPTITSQRFLPTRVGALSIVSPVANAYSTYNSVYEAANEFQQGYVEGILQTMILASGQSAPAEEAHMLPTVSAVRELVDAVTVTPFSTTEEFRTLNYGLGEHTFSGTNGGDETFAGVPDFEIFSDTGSNAYDDATSNALTNNEAIVVKTSDGYSHINPIGVGLAVNDDYTVNRPSAIGFLTAGADIFKGTSLRAIIDKMLRAPLQTVVDVIYNGSGNNNQYFETGYPITDTFQVEVEQVQNAGPGPAITDAQLNLSKTNDNLFGSIDTGIDGTNTSLSLVGAAWYGTTTTGTATFDADFAQSGEIASSGNRLRLGTTTSLSGYWRLSASVPNLDASQSAATASVQLNAYYRSFAVSSDFDWTSQIAAGNIGAGTPYPGGTGILANGTLDATGATDSFMYWLAGAQEETGATTGDNFYFGGTGYNAIQISETVFSQVDRITPTGSTLAADVSSFGGYLMHGSNIRNATNPLKFFRGNVYTSSVWNGGGNYLYILVPAVLFGSESEAIEAQFVNTGGVDQVLKIVMSNNGTSVEQFNYTNQYGISYKMYMYQAANPGSHPLSINPYRLVG